MALLERVSTLIRANLNDLVDKAEDPEKMIKQVILDMENQYLQVKTQVAVSIADQHMLEKKWKENEDTGNDWMRKAERAVDKSEDDLARGALDRYQTALRLAQSFREQVDDQKTQVDTLKGALQKLEQKLDEARSKRDLLLARQRRSVALGSRTLFIPEHKASDRGETNGVRHEHRPVEMFRRLPSGHARQSPAGRTGSMRGVAPRMLSCKSQ